MAGTLFLDALKKKQELEKGYPVPEGSAKLIGPTGPVYKATSAIDRAVHRLKASVTGPESPSPYEAVRGRLEAEQSEGQYRNKPDVTKVGLPRKMKSNGGMK